MTCCFVVEGITPHWCFTMLLTLCTMRNYKHHLSSALLLITHSPSRSHIARAMIDTMQEAARFSWTACFKMLLFSTLVVLPSFQLRRVLHHKMKVPAAGHSMALLYGCALLLHRSHRVSYFHGCSCLFSLQGLRQKNNQKDQAFL